MLKKLKKTLSKEFKKRYEKMESHYLGLENRIYTTIEARISALEIKFEELSDLIKDEVRVRKERNEDKMEERDIYGFDEDDNSLSERLDDVKEVIESKIKEAKETVNEKVEEVAKQVDKAKEIVAQTFKKGSAASETTSPKATTSAVENNDLTALKGLGEKMAEKLEKEGITSFEQLAGMSKEEVEALDEKIKSFAARFKRYEWKQQAEDKLS